MIISVTIGGALSFELSESGTMKRPPRSSAEPLGNKHVIFRTAWVTAAMVVSILLSFQWALDQGYSLSRSRSVAFSTLVASSVAYGLNCRSLTDFSLGASLWRPNVPFWTSALLVLALQVLIVHTPIVNRFFSCESHDVAAGSCAAMGSGEWFVASAAAVALFILVEIEKALVTAVRGGSATVTRAKND